MDMDRVLAGNFVSAGRQREDQVDNESEDQDKEDAYFDEGSMNYAGVYSDEVFHDRAVRVRCIALTCFWLAVTC